MRKNVQRCTVPTKLAVQHCKLGGDVFYPATPIEYTSPKLFCTDCKIILYRLQESNLCKEDEPERTSSKKGRFKLARLTSTRLRNPTISPSACRARATAGRSCSCAPGLSFEFSKKNRLGLPVIPVSSSTGKRHLTLTGKLQLCMGICILNVDVFYEMSWNSDRRAPISTRKTTTTQ